MKPARRQAPWHATLAALLCAGVAAAMAQPAAQHSVAQLRTHFSCSVTRTEDLGRVIYADSGDIDIDGGHINSFQWESALHRETHGFDCSIDQSDDLQAEAVKGGWRISLKDSDAARLARGYDFGHGLDCAITLLRSGDEVQVAPNCPALCGSRANFSALTVNLKTGTCHYAPPTEQ